MLGAEDRARVALEGDRLLEHRERVAEDVAVVVAVLLDALERGDLRQHDPERADVGQQADAVRRRVVREQEVELGEDALAGDPVEAVGGGARRGRSWPGRSRSRATSARRATRTTRSGSSSNARGPAMRSTPGVEVGAPTGGIDEVAARERLGDRVDGEVAQPEVRVQRSAVDRAEVDAPAAIRRQDPPRAELLGQREHRAADGLRDALRGGLGVAVDDEVEVVDRAPEQPVAHRAADDPRRLARERVARRPRGAQPWLRGTRGSSSQVIS